MDGDKNDLEVTIGELTYCLDAGAQANLAKLRIRHSRGEDVSGAQVMLHRGTQVFLMPFPCVNAVMPDLKSRVEASAD